MVSKLALFGLLLAAAVLYAEAKSFTTSLGRRESYRQQLLREGKFAEFRIMSRVKQSMIKHRGQRLKVARQPFYDYADAEYYGKQLFEKGFLN